LGVPATVEAHALGAEAKLKNGKVTIEAFYDDDTPAGGATVVVTGADGQSVAEGKTDETGRWTFNAPPAGKYKVALRTGDGHRATVALVIPDTKNAAPTAIPGEPINSTAPTALDEGVIVSEGPTRSEFTGSMRLVWAVVGVAVIGGVTWVVLHLVRAVKRSPATQGGL
jgi:hypothetical protein